MRVAVALSGGVDSAVTALLLKRKGFNLIGIYMNNWTDDNLQTICQIDENRRFAQTVCHKLDIEFKELNFVKTYWNNVFSYLLESYKRGQTPNPDVMCNKFVKFGSFVDYCINKLNVEAIATGHYAGTSYGNFWQNYSIDKPVKLLIPKDKVKDQTLFLSQISQNSLRRVMFPIQHLLKTEVKTIAKQNGFQKIAEKPESKGICFIGKRNFKQFISQYIEPKPGPFVDIDTGISVGTHSGIHLWTLGEQCRIGGQKSKYFVVKKIIETNEILVTSNSEDISLLSNRLTAKDPNWICSEPQELSMNRVFECQFRFQNKDPIKPCRVFKSNQNTLYIELYEDFRAITEGQFAVLYKDQQCLGSASIDNYWHSEYGSQILNYQIK